MELAQVEPLAGDRVQSTQLRKYLWAFLWTVFSSLVTVVWPLVQGRSPWLAWNFSVLGITVGMISLSVSRFFDVRHPFAAPELVLLVFSMAQRFSFPVFLPGGTTRAADEFLFCFDIKMFGQNCDVILAKLFNLCPALGLVCGAFYCALPAVVVFVYLALPNSRQVRQRYCALIALTAVVLFAMYSICPGAGPKFLFRADFPYKVPAQIVPHLRFIPGAVLNATPSGHIAWALLLLWAARWHCGKYCQYNCVVFLIFTILSTMGLGEHYVIDLIAGVPFAAGMWVLMDRRWQEAICAFLLVAAWSVALRSGWALQLPREAAWLACAATVAFPFYLRPISPVAAARESVGFAAGSGG